jgi:hypothetical protein
MKGIQVQIYIWFPHLDQVGTLVFVPDSKQAVEFNQILNRIHYWIWIRYRIRIRNQIWISNMI